jgi:ABC-type Na+ efflux pump permease subunit
MLAVPLFFAIALPLFTFYITLYNAPVLMMRIASITTAPSYLRSLIGSSSLLAYFSVSILGPVFMTMPILTASVIAADSFAGEKERKTSEALLSTPVSMKELLLGKILASLIPTILLTICVFALYGSVVNVLAFHYLGRGVLPTVPWIMMILMSPLLALAAISIVVIISSHVRGTKEAQQITTLLILPILLLPFVSTLGVADLTFGFLAYLSAFLIALDFLAIYMGVRSFRKEAIL